MAMTFGALLRHLRRRHGMTQSELSARIGYSRSMVTALELDQRLPDVDAVIRIFLPVLGLHESSEMGAQLVEMAAAARREYPPLSFAPEHRRPAGSGVSGAATAAPPRSHHIPIAPTPLVGRTREIQLLCDRFLDQGTRLLTLVGPPGVGKTSLALTVATRLQMFFSDGACYVSLAAVNNPDLVVTTLLEALDVFHGSPMTAKARLIAHLRHREILLVLDNFEQVVAAARLLSEVLAECEGVRILVTSRETLHLRAEQRFQVPPLELSAAVDLFAQRARAVDSDFLLDAGARPTVETICRHLDCLPLAIELSAIQVDVLAPSQLLARLQDHRLDLLVESAVDHPPRQQTLRRALHASYVMLSDEESALFRSLAVFTGGFALPEVSEMWRLDEASAPDGSDSAAPRRELTNVLSSLRALVAKSMVRAEKTDTGEIRYLLLETLHEYALEQAIALGEEATWRAHHFRAYYCLLLAADRNLRGPDAATWLERLQRDLENLRGAFRWAMTERRFADAARFKILSSYFMALGNHAYEDASDLALLLPHREDLDRDMRIAFLLSYCRASAALDGFPSTESFMTEVNRLLQDCPYLQLHATAWSFRVWTTDDVEQAFAFQERGIELARASSHSPSLGAEYGAMADGEFVLAVHLWGYAASLTDQGRTHSAAAPANEALRIFEMRGIRTGVCESLGVLGSQALYHGAISQAHTYFREATAITNTLNYGTTQHDWQAALAVTHIYQGNFAEARRLLALSFRRFSEQKNTVVLAQIYTDLADVALWEGEVAEAEDSMAQCLTLQGTARRFTVPLLVQVLLAGRLATAQEDYRRAAMIFGFGNQAQRRMGIEYPGPLRAPADAALVVLRSTLDPQEFVDAFAEGERTPLANAFRLMLSRQFAAG